MPNQLVDLAFGLDRVFIRLPDIYTFSLTNSRLFQHELFFFRSGKSRGFNTKRKLPKVLSWKRIQEYVQ